MGREYCGIVEEIGSAVRSIKPGQFVIGSFFTSDNACPHCQNDHQELLPAPRIHRRHAGAMLHVPLADGTLMPTSEVPVDDLIPSLLAVSDVMGIGWFAAETANVKPGSTVAVVGDGAVGLLRILSAMIMGPSGSSP
jgi:threonine dehydrogenase-like Zn-dependent dehydrogenase